MDGRRASGERLVPQLLGCPFVASLGPSSHLCLQAPYLALQAQDGSGTQLFLILGPVFPLWRPKRYHNVPSGLFIKVSSNDPNLMASSTSDML